jgi:hypothetical protein
VLDCSALQDPISNGLRMPPTERRVKAEPLSPVKLTS